MIQPNQVPAYVSPGSNGGAVLQTPGRRPTYLIPRGDGSYVIPGQTPTYVTHGATAPMSFNRRGVGRLILRQQYRADASPQGAASRHLKRIPIGGFRLLLTSPNFANRALCYDP